MCIFFSLVIYFLGIYVVEIFKKEVCKDIWVRMFIIVLFVIKKRIRILMFINRRVVGIVVLYLNYENLYNYLK